MSTTSRAVPAADGNDPVLGQLDFATVLEHFATDRLLDPAIVERVRARAAQVTADIRRDRGLVDDDTFQSLLDDEA